MSKNENLKNNIDYKKHYENDNIFYKEIIKERLINNSNIIESLNSKELDPECPADYMGEHLLPFYMIYPTQDQAKNYICFDTSFQEIPRYNKIMKYGQIIFNIVCDIKEIYDKNTGIARHDLLAALISKEFDWTNLFGMQVHLVSDKPMSVDNNYIGRTLIFEQTTPNSIIKEQKVINKSGG